MRFLAMILLLNLFYVVPPVGAHPTCYKKKQPPCPVIQKMSQTQAFVPV